MSQHGYPERVSRRRAGGKACADDAGTIEVLVETLTGTAFEMTVSPLDTVLAIKSKIFRVEGIPISQQHLLYNLKELDNASSLQEHCIDDGATLRLVLSMRGGPISTHRLPLPTGDPVNWQEIKELVESDREDGAEWLPAGSKVTVLVFRDGDNVNMVRVLENDDGTYSPLADTHTKSSSSLKSLVLEAAEEGSLQENAVTMSKMLELRRRMESLSLQRSRRAPHHHKLDEAADAKLMQKTRSEETLSTMDGLFEEASAHEFKNRSFQYADADDTFSPLYDGNYTRYDYDCSFADRYTLLPPITADSEQSGGEEERACGSGVGMSRERIKLSDALAGSILVKSSAHARREEDEAAILEEGVCVEGVEECRLAPDTRLAKKLLGHAPIPTAEYGPLVGGEAVAGGWRVRRAFGSSSQLAPPAPLAPAHSASSLRPPHVHPHPPPLPLPLPLSDALFSSSTSDLEKLKRNRFLPTLCRHRNREHLDVSDERLDRDDARRPARNLEVGSERRHRRIKKIAELERAEAATFRFDDAGYESSIRKLPNDGVSERSSCLRRIEPVGTPAPVAPVAPVAPHVQQATPVGDIVNVDTPGKKMTRVRCGLCRKRLSIATVHRCRCGAEFCAPHRYAEVHGCAYDYKAHAHQYLQRANPLVSAPKLPKI